MCRIKHLYHYYDKTIGPFKNLSDLPVENAKSILEEIKTTKPNSQSATRHDKYVEYRRNFRTEFVKKGGKILREAPYYMVVGHSPCLYSVLRSMMESMVLKDTLKFRYGVMKLLGDLQNKSRSGDKVNEIKECFDCC